VVTRDWPPDQQQALLGIRLPPGPNWPLPRLHWWTRAQPEVWERVRWILQAKDFIGWRLTGSLCSDASSWRGLVHLPDGALVPQVCRYLGLSDAIVPPRQDPSASRGPLRPSVAEALGLPATVQVATGWNDFNCAALGAGLAEGDGFDIAGTSDHLGVVTRQSLPADPRLIAAPFVPRLQLVYGVTAMSGGALEWARQCLAEDADEDTWRALLHRVQRLAPGAQGVLFWPHLWGERAPLWDPQARAAFIGLTGSHRPEHLIRAVLEGVAFHLATIRDLLPGARTLRSVKAVGGPTRLAVWNQIRADVLGLDYWVADAGDAGCRGAAMLAAPLAGLDPAALTTACTWTRFTPNPAALDAYAPLYQLFQGAYARLEPIFHALSSMPATTDNERNGDHT
jgi:xylulokinase